MLLGEPGSAFLGHEVPFSGHGISIGLKLFRFLKSKGWAGNISVAGTDGCNVNTGYKAQMDATSTQDTKKDLWFIWKSFLADPFPGTYACSISANCHFVL